ncbi:MAG TPA: DUF5807 family protein [Halococcus sp.]|nr:DUF5807 family protein [Halococcus sp.]
MNTERREFLGGERTEDVLLFFAESAVSDLGTLAQHGEQVPRGVVLILEAERGRSAFEGATGIDPMTLASAAMDSVGQIDLDTLEGTCPEAEADSEEHAPRFVFAFAEEQNESVGGIYAEGDVIHAYAVCECGTVYSDRWIAGER